MKILKKNLIPFYFLIGFNLLTLLLFVVSPFNYYGGNVLLVQIYILVNLLTLSLGYIAGCMFGQKLNTRNKVFIFKENIFSNFIFGFYCLTFFIKYAYLLRFSIFDWSGMISYLAIGWADPQLGYQLSVDNIRPFTVPWSIYFFTSIFHSLFFINGFIFWKKFNKYFKLIFILFLLLEISFWYGRGTNFGIIMLALTLFFSRLQYITKLNFKLVLGSVFLFVLTLMVFYTIMSFRSSTNAEVDLNPLIPVNANINYNSAVLKLFPTSAWSTILLIFSYLTQGYYHLSYAFDLPFTFTYFSGYSFASLDFAKLIGFDFYNDTYIYKLNKFGIDPTINWHSAYLWYANDVSLLGVPFVIFFMGFLTALFWVMADRTKDILYRIMFVIFSTNIIFLFANTTFVSFFYYDLLVLLPIIIIKVSLAISNRM